MSEGAHIDYLDMGPWPVYFGFTMDEEAFKAELVRVKCEEDVPFMGSDHAHATLHIFHRDMLFLIMTLDKSAKRRTPSQIASLVAHEAVHAVQRIRREFSLDHEIGDESEAYLVQHIVMFVLEIINGKRRFRRTIPA